MLLKRSKKEVDIYKKILAPLDGSKLAECTLEHIRAIAMGCQVPEVVLLQIIEPISRPGYLPAELAEDTYRRAKDTAEVQAKDYLSEVAESLGKEGIAVGTDIAYGLPADEILNYAKNNDVDLIIMSTHGRAGISRWVFGSVAERIVRHSLIPVLVVTPRGCRIST
jgi:nucleotide-binding universal stress UspA family protein